MVHQPRPIARKLPDQIALRSGDQRCLVGAVPMSPLVRNPHSPREWRNRDSCCVGLQIAVALEKAGEIPRKLHSTAPIAIGHPRACGGASGGGRPEVSGFAAGASCCASSPSPADIVEEEFCVADFLVSCHLCRKNLHGKDIFMYREKAFCSEDCRYQQMMSDEYQEKYRGRTPKRSPEIASSSPYNSGGQLFFTGIVVS
ncbi:hypothetical protein Cni_G11367 [Canna indica]|uniref:FLZ-type domain-containing protein n=1 Tax=Canna indica TaxID=4628 RepID=A0AAQ3K8L5_9LILI|nr:hypothetical protein Cni_G11367 [Canna indica]